MTNIARRRFIQLAAAFGAGAALPISTLATTQKVARWKGIALGAEAQLTLVHLDRQQAEAVLQQCVAEIDRLESIFSLYREDSALMDLNRKGELQNSPPELFEVIAAAKEYGSQSDGLFDVTIQPLWQLYHQHFQQSQADPTGPDVSDINAALHKVDYRHINLSSDRITLQPGMAITLNGIAQGYITDRIAALLKTQGFENALINLGEYQAMGKHTAARDWKVGIPTPDQPWKISKELAIPAGKALATSGAYGTRWREKAHHLLSPKTGYPVHTDHASVSVIADSAMQADALATICSLQSSAESQHGILKRHPEAAVYFL